MEIQWYPGHMARTKRLMQEDLRRADAICEIVDARIPEASRNPDIGKIAAGKPCLILLNRADLADPAKTALWEVYFKRSGFSVMVCDAKSGAGVSAFPGAVRKLLADKLRRYEEKGMAGRPVKVMIAGIPNVGKSSFINRVLGKKTAKAEDRPGVTRHNQWFKVDSGIEMLDTPGILPPKLKDKEAGMLLAYTGAVKDQILDLETLACGLLYTLTQVAPQAIIKRYDIVPPPLASDGDPDSLIDPEIAYGYELLQALARKRGFLRLGKELDTERMARILLDEYRDGKLGRITLELPPEEGADGRSV